MPKKHLTVLVLGDVVGEKALSEVCRSLPALKRKYGAQFAVVNGENASLGHGNGITPAQAQELLFAGCDLITTGNHVFAQRTLYDYLDEHADAIIRPANYPSSCPGKGYAILEKEGTRLLVSNISGRINMNETALSSPFERADAILDYNKGNYDFAIFDFHAEATSEKYCFAAYVSSRADAVFGTHTHVATADARIIGSGCAFITDIGMCGPRDSAIGVDERIIIELMKNGMPQKFRVSENRIYLSGAVISLCTDKAENKIEAFSIAADEIR